MRNISDDELDFILGDIKANGVVIEDLQNSLLDHICCIIENEMPVNEDFYKFYAQILPRFFKKDLKELQVETENLLTFKNYYAMRNTLKISGIVSALFTILGASLKVLHLPGASFAIILGGTLFSLLFLPLMIVLKFKDEEKQVDKIVLSFGFLIAIVAFTGVIFKLMHWPWANIMMISGSATFVFAYVPIYYFTRVRRPEIRFNTTINSVLMMASGGLMFALMNLGFNTKLKYKTDFVEKTMQENIRSFQRTNESLVLKIKVDENIQAINEISSKLIQLLQQKETKKEVLLDELTRYNNMILKFYPNNKEYLVSTKYLNVEPHDINLVDLESNSIALKILSTENTILSKL